MSAAQYGHAHGVLAAVLTPDDIASLRLSPEAIDRMTARGLIEVERVLDAQLDDIAADLWDKEPA